MAIAERVHRDLALSGIRAPLVHVEEYLAVLRFVGCAPLGESAEEPLVVLLRDHKLNERQPEHVKGEVADLHAVAPLRNERERIAVEDEAGTIAVHRHVALALKMHNHFLHASGAAHGGEEVILGALLEEMVFPLREPKSIAVLKTLHRRADSRRGVPFDRPHLDNCANSGACG